MTDFTFAVGDEESSAVPSEDTFVKDTRDNSLFPEIQVTDITPIITPDCIGIFDADKLIWTACANEETKYIVVTCTSDPTLTAELAGVQVFSGLGKGIKKDSWLYNLNVDRAVQDLPPLAIEDFTIEDKQKLKVEEGKAIEAAKIQIYKTLKKIRLQYGIPRIKMILGEGDCFRANLPLCRKYKGQRKAANRPLLLNKLRKWAIDETGAELAQLSPKGEVVETDDVVEYYGALGYKHYRKTGKFNYLVIAADKDAKNNPKLLIDPDRYVQKDNPKKGLHKFPQAMLIEATDKSVGDIAIVTGKSGTDHKFYGFKGLLWQAFLSGDGADNYNCLSHLKQDLNFGDESAYKLLKPCKTPKEALQKTIDKFAELLPYGVQYTDWKGVKHDMDTMEYMNNYFLTAYMRRSATDAMDFYKLCSAMKVNTKAITHNNLLTPPVRCFEPQEEVIKEADAKLLEITGNIKGYSTLKKADLIDMITTLKSQLTDLIGFSEKCYVMKQMKKEENNE